MIIEYCEKCTIRIDAACYMDPQNAAKYCRKCGTNNPALVPFDPNEKPNSGKTSGTRIKTPSGTRLKVTSGTRLKSLGESPSTPTTAASIDNSKPPDSYNKHVGNMAFYFCEKCGRRLSEDDLSKGLAKNKQLKGVYCSSCSVGVNTMEMDAVNLQDVLKKSGGSAAYKALQPDSDPETKPTHSPLAAHFNKPKKKTSSSSTLISVLPFVTITIFIVIVILMSKSTDDSSAKANPKKSAPPQSTIVAESDVAKKKAEQESVRRAAEEKAALEKTKLASQPAIEPNAATTPPTPAASPHEAPTALTLAAREEQAMKEMQELRAQREAKLKEAQANAVQQALTPNPQNTSQVETTWTPKELNSAVWYDASDASTITHKGGAVSQWKDKSGNGRDAKQTNVALQPATGAAINGKNALNFPLDAGKFLNTSFTQLTTASIYLVVDAERKGRKKNNCPLGASTLYSEGGCYITLQDFHTSAPGHAVFYATMIPGSYLNGTNQATNHGFNPCIISHQGTSLKTQNLEYRIGAASSDNREYYYGTIGEIIICNADHDAATRQKIEGYLAHKWGLQDKLPAGHPYKTTPPQNK